MFVAKHPFYFKDHLFGEGDEIPEKIVSQRMKDLDMVSLKEDPEIKTEKPKKKREEKILTENSSKVEIVKE